MRVTIPDPIASALRTEARERKISVARLVSSSFPQHLPVGTVAEAVAKRDAIDAQIAALKVARSQIRAATDWEPWDGGDLYRFRPFDGAYRVPAARIMRCVDDFAWTALTKPTVHGRAETLEKAKAACDAALFEGGYVLDNPCA